MTRNSRYRFCGRVRWPLARAAADRRSSWLESAGAIVTSIQTQLRTVPALSLLSRPSSQPWMLKKLTPTRGNLGTSAGMPANAAIPARRCNFCGASRVAGAFIVGHSGVEHSGPLAWWSR